MNTYSKIDTLFDRDERFKVVVGAFRRPEYEDISVWDVTEKIDGTNIRIRIGYDRPTDEVTLKVAGKTDNASIPPKLLAHCVELLPANRDFFKQVITEHDIECLTLHGEGYGAKIQKSGGNYRPDQGFVLFDVEIDEASAFLGQDVVTHYAWALDIPRVPLLGTMPTQDIVEMVSVGFTSQIGGTAEGVVARTRTPLYDNRGARVMWKLKTKDFAGPVARAFSVPPQMHQDVP